MSNTKMFLHTVTCLAILAVVSVPFYNTVRATERAKTERQVESYVNVASIR